MAKASESEAGTSELTVKERIHQVSVDLFAEKGYHATGIQEISDAVGLGRGALYYHIQSKENLLFEISIRPLREMLDKARAISTLDLPATDRVRLLSSQRVSEIAQKRNEWNVALYQSSTLSPKLREEVDKTRIAYEAMWERVLHDGVVEGLWDEPDPLLLRGILGMLNSVYLWIDPKGAVAPSEIGQRFANLVLEGMVRRDDSSHG